MIEGTRKKLDALACVLVLAIVATIALVAIWLAIMVNLARCSANACPIPTPSVYSELVGSGVPGSIIGVIMLLILPISAIIAMVVIPEWKNYRGLLDVGMEPMMSITTFIGKITVNLATYISTLILFLRADAVWVYSLPITGHINNVILITAAASVIGVIPMLFVGRIMTGVVEGIAGITYITFTSIHSRNKS